MINIKKGISYFLYLFYTAVIIFSQTSNTGAKMSLEELYGPQTANILRSEGKIMYVPDLKKGEDLKYFKDAFSIRGCEPLVFNETRKTGF